MYGGLSANRRFWVKCCEDFGYVGHLRTWEYFPSWSITNGDHVHMILIDINKLYCPELILEGHVLKKSN
jgi:hypothetical protein